MLPFFGLHALFEGAGGAAQRLVRGVRDGGGAVALSLLFVSLLAAGAMALLIGRIPATSKPSRPRPVIREPRGTAWLDEAHRDLSKAYRRGDWDRVWRRLSYRAQEEIATVVGYGPMTEWRKRGSAILRESMKDWPKDRPPGALYAFAKAGDAKHTRIVWMSDSRVRIEAGGEVTNWVHEQSGGW
jgi:hypothetical protein